MTGRRREVEDAFEQADTRWLAADDAHDLIRRLHRQGDANDVELLSAEETLERVQRQLTEAFRAVADVAAADLRSALDAAGLGGEAYSVAVKVHCTWSEPHSAATCARVVGRVVVTAGDRWMWVAAGAPRANDLGPASEVVGSCSKHGDRPVDGARLQAAIVIAQRRPKRWPIVERAD